LAEIACARNWALAIRQKRAVSTPSCFLAVLGRVFAPRPQIPAGRGLPFLVRGLGLGRRQRKTPLAVRLIAGNQGLGGRMAPRHLGGRCYIEGIIQVVVRKNTSIGPGFQFCPSPARSSRTQAPEARRLRCDFTAGQHGIPGPKTYRAVRDSMIRWSDTLEPSRRSADRPGREFHHADWGQWPNRAGMVTHQQESGRLRAEGAASRWLPPERSPAQEQEQHLSGTAAGRGWCHRRCAGAVAAESLMSRASSAHSPDASALPAEMAHAKRGRETFRKQPFSTVARQRGIDHPKI